jgi:hypothetical protein
MIVPFIAVMQELRSRCIDYRIKCANWDCDNRVTGHVDRLCVAAEQAIEPASETIFRCCTAEGD